MSDNTIHAGTCSCGASTVQLFRTGKCAHCYIAELEAKYAAECEASMMAGSQLSALRLQLKDAEERASRWARVADQSGAALEAARTALKEQAQEIVSLRVGSRNSASDRPA